MADEEFAIEGFKNATTSDYDSKDAHHIEYAGATVFLGNHIWGDGEHAEGRVRISVEGTCYKQQAAAWVTGASLPCVAFQSSNAFQNAIGPLPW